MSFKAAGIGQVPAHWEVAELRAFLRRITYGFTNPMPDTDEGPWKLTAKDVVNGYINYDTARRTSQEAFDKLLTDKSRPNVGDVLLTKDGSIGRVAVVDREGICINQSVALLQPNEKINPYFLKYLLIAPYYQRVMDNDSDGSTIKHIYITRVDKMEIAVPPVEEQERILQVIKTLDDKIELNRQINQALEQIAQTIFKSWFVDFEPVKAKIEAKAAGQDPERAAMCAISGKLEPELDQLPPEQYQQLAATAALFPDALVKSELGLIPEGWEVRPLDQIADYLNGLALQKFPPENDTDYLPVIKIAQLKKGDTEGADRASSKLKPEYIVNDGDVLFSWSGSLAVDVWCGGLGALNQHLFKVTSPDYPKWFYLFWTKFHLIDFQSIAADKAVTMGHIQRKHLTAALCVVPPALKVEKFDAFVAPLLAQQIELRKESRDLATLRDTLLPKLLSGELTVGNCEQQVEACA
jgi:type I restriction enzyme S subunit